MKPFRKHLWMALVAAYLAATAFTTELPAQVVPEPASSIIPMRGFQGDLSSTGDKFLSLDLNGDGKADMLYYRAGGGYAGAYLSHGDGTFRYVAYVNNGTGYNGFSGDLSSAQDTFVALDLNGDGKSDFIEYRPGSGYTIKCLSNGDGTVNCIFLSQPGQQYNGFKDSMTNGAERVVAMDLNHDGRSDFIVYSPGGGYARAYLSLANGNVQAVDLTVNGAANGSIGFAEDMRPGNVRVVPIDANGDGYADLLAYTPQYSEVRLYLNNRNNTFQKVDLAYSGSRSGGFTGDAGDPNSHLIALDLNGDGKQDFLWWQAGSRTVIGYLSSGNGSFTAVNYQANGSTANGFQDNDNSTADTAVALDADGDGKQEFFWYSPGSNNVATLYLSGASGVLNGAVFYGGQFSASRSNGVVLPLNFLGQAASGFVSYVPGSGANGGAPLFNAYTLANSDRQSSILGRLNTFNFYAHPGSFLTDLNWSLGNVPLKEIVMPGTHDSAMYAMTDGQNDINETQWGSSLTDQLDAGARALDFRAGYYVNVNSGFYNVEGGIMIIDQVPAQTSNGFYMAGHSNTLSNVTALASLNQIENWLGRHPGEVVLVDLLPSISGKQRNMTSQFVSLIQQTDHPELIYTPLKACGAAVCSNPNLQPHNTTVANLIAQNTRMVLLSDQVELNGYGWTWNRSNTYVGYCENYEAGRSTSIDEIDCINNASNESGSNGTSIGVARPNYEAADAATGFMTLKATLTPGGFASTGQVISLLPPLTLADAGYPYGFNVGNQPYDLKKQMENGAWNNNALNLWNIDGLRANDELTRLILQRNRQTWVNAHFFNNKSDNPAGALSIGSNGDIWAAGAGHSISIFKYNRATGAWAAKINGMPNVKRLATDPQGGVWVVDGSQGASSTMGRVIHYDLNGQNASVTNFIAQDVAVGKNGSVWGIDQYGVFEVSGPTDGSPDIRNSVSTQNGSRVTVDNKGYPWVIDDNGYIRKFDGSTWQQVSSSKGREIVAGVDGSIFIAGYNTPSIGRYNIQNNNFDFLQMDADRIAVEPGGQPWAIRHGTGTIYKGSLDQM